MGRFIAGSAHRVAGPAGSSGVLRIAQQIQLVRSILFRVQQHPHTQGGIQLLPAVSARQIGQTVIIFGALLLAGADVIQQGSQAVLPGLVLPVPAQQLAADLIAGSFDLKSGLQCFVGHNVSPSYNQKTEEAQPPPSFIYIIN